jgi:hypothetical protein
VLPVEARGPPLGPRQQPAADAATASARQHRALGVDAVDVAGLAGTLHPREGDELLV